MKQQDPIPHSGAAEAPPRHYTVGDRRWALAGWRRGLYVVATPIGHLGDITLRALELAGRRRRHRLRGYPGHAKLTDRYGIATPLDALSRPQCRSGATELMARLAAGAAIALVSDAGTPLISDPGYRSSVRRAQPAMASPRYPAPRP